MHGSSRFELSYNRSIFQGKGRKGHLARATSYRTDIGTKEVLEENCHYALHLGPALKLMHSFSPLYFLVSLFPFSFPIRSLVQPCILMYPGRSTKILFILLSE